MVFSAFLEGAVKPSMGSGYYRAVLNGDITQVQEYMEPAVGFMHALGLYMSISLYIPFSGSPWAHTGIQLVFYLPLALSCVRVKGS